MHTVEYLRENLIHIKQDSIRLNKIVEYPDISLLIRKALPALDNVIVDIRVKNKENTYTINAIDDKYTKIHT